ncbi:hypothetical protein [Nannocystis radixulma]|uniref:Uncharacterized protein n=1 Tax=Nannocystis radixulma TaxID=2995305 RepID=A0ABT5AZR4_9BACT|nr:hypothetical protein [Nannocystis radixulma]MDC0666427.1 hypothetical protein [Nannocystis radixulma]
MASDLAVSILSATPVTVTADRTRSRDERSMKTKTNTRSGTNPLYKPA